MSRATKRKYVTKEVIEDFIELGDDQEIVKVNNYRNNYIYIYIIHKQFLRCIVASLYLIITTYEPPVIFDHMGGTWGA